MGKKKKKRKINIQNGVMRLEGVKNLLGRKHTYVAKDDLPRVVYSITLPSNAPKYEMKWSIGILRLYRMVDFSLEEWGRKENKISEN